MGGATNLPPGFHFFPSDEELVVHFLRRKASLLPCHPDIIPTLLLRLYDPWELNGKALEAGNQWYFFSHATQSRTSPNGYWNTIGAEETVTSGGCNVGLKKTLIFSTGKPLQGIKTNWIMHEYHLLDGGRPGPGEGREGQPSQAQHIDGPLPRYIHSTYQGMLEEIFEVKKNSGPALDGGCSASGISASSASPSSNRKSHKKRGHSSTESNSWVICRVFESSCGSQVSFHDEGTELSCLDEVFLSLDDYDEVSLPNN